MERFIHQGATIGQDVEIGRFSVIDDGVIVGDGTKIGHHVIIHGGSKIGSNVRIDDNSVIGKLPMSAKRSKTTQSGRLIDPAVIGDDVIIGTGAIVYAGASIGNGVLIADTAVIREDVTVGELTIIGRNVTVENRVTVGSRCKIQTDAYICAYSEIGDDCFIAPCAVTSNDNYAGRWKERTKYYKGITMKNGSRLAVNATILPGKVIGEDGMAAAGAVITGDVPDGTIVSGNPARHLRDVPENQLLKNQED
jgi:UDP-2-acetamido-3-amino-2,3-dideoxy-glucuronate N-acetyltransferase